MWRARNTLSFENKCLNVGDIEMLYAAQLAHIKSAYSLENAPAGRESPWQISWYKPPHGAVALNVDGSNLSNSGHTTGFGGLIRDDNGVFLHSFYSGTIKDDIVYAEIMAILHGLSLCWNGGYKDVVYISDSLVAVNCVLKCVLVHHMYSNEIEAISE